MDPSHAPLSQRKMPDYTLDLFVDPGSAKDIVKAVLHTIFFHRYFTPITPLSRDLLDLTLPAIDDVDLETLIDQRAAQLVRDLGSGGTSAGVGGGAGAAGTGGGDGGGGGPGGLHPAVGRAGTAGNGNRGQLAVQFYEKKRRKAYFSFGKAEEEVCWEQWTLDVTLAVPRTETDVIKVRRAMEKSLMKTTMKIIDIVNRDKAHIPAITTTEGNPFPYQILVNPKMEGWGQRMGIF